VFSGCSKESQNRGLTVTEPSATIATRADATNHGPKVVAVVHGEGKGETGGPRVVGEWQRGATWNKGRRLSTSHSLNSLRSAGEGWTTLCVRRRVDDGIDTSGGSVTPAALPVRATGRVLA
jgi:hypothetical protein